jgi:hypothetical protein
MGRNGLTGLGIAAVCTVVSVTALTILPALARDPVGVRTTRREEFYPAAAVGYLAWSENSRSRPNHYNLFVKPQGSAKFKVNPRRTQAFAGNIDGTTLVYRQDRGNQKGDIKFFDLSTSIRSDPPDGVNTARNHESLPSRSGDWLLFRRSRDRFSSTQRIILYNLVTDEERLLATGDGDAKWAQPGQLRGDFVTWSKCRGSRLCNTYRYQISTATTTKVPNAGRKVLLASSVTAGGTVYFSQNSNINCGGRPGIWRYPIGGPKTQLVSLGRGHGAGITSPVDNGDGTTTVFYDRGKCGTRKVDIYKFTVAT